jgi:hypothetical protein
MVILQPLDGDGIKEAQSLVTAHHYLHRPVDVRTMVEGYAVHLAFVGQVGVLLFGRPEATRCYPWYGSVEDVRSGRADVTRWQVLNLSRVWLDPKVQPGGELYSAGWLPGYVDRRGVWRSTLASTAIRQARELIGWYYLMRRPPCFVEEPYEIRWLMSYCDTRLHRGTVYMASGFDLYRTNDRCLQTWRVRLPELSAGEDEAVRLRAETHPRSIRMRGRRSQLSFSTLTAGGWA